MESDVTMSLDSLLHVLNTIFMPADGYDLSARMCACVCACVRACDCLSVTKL